MPDEIDGLLSEATGSTAVVRTGPKKVNYSHMGMVDLIIANPGISQNAIAAHFGYSASWVSQVLSSDAVQDLLASRTAEIVDPALRLTVEENFKAIVRRSQEILLEKLHAPVISDNLVLRAAELGSRALGLGAREQPGSTLNVNLHLEDLGGRLDKLLERKKLAQVVEGEVISQNSQVEAM
jgi:hypothetical protein